MCGCGAFFFRRNLPFFPHQRVLILYFFFLPFPISEAFDSVLLLNSSWNCSISKSSSSLPSSFPGGALAKSGRGTAHQRLAAISRGPHVSNSGQPWLQTGTLKQATTRPVIPVSTLVSGIDNGPIHLGPLKLAWHFKGEDREPGQPDTACKRVETEEGRDGGKKVFLACDETEYVWGSDLEHCGIMYKYRAYGMESF